jgi:hypothetical protein
MQCPFEQFLEKHLIPKWLLALLAKELEPELLSTKPCAKIILAGMPNFLISATAILENRFM